jgi:NDP-sugar pyrophosphorylase family protein
VGHVRDLAGFEHRALFDDTLYVWEALENIGGYLARVLDPRIDGLVMPGAWVAGNVSVGEGAVIEPGAMVQGPAIIGRQSQIRHGSYLRGNVIVGDGAVVGHCCELKTAVLLNQASAAHLNYVGDSILGNGANLGAGAICANRKVTGEEVVIAVGDKRHPTGLTKLGAIVGDHAQIGCNACLAPGTLIGKHSLVYSLASVQGYCPPNSIVKARPRIEIAKRRWEAGERE